MADESYIDDDGIPRSERRTGDPWRRKMHGRIDRIEERLADGDTKMGTLSIQTRQLGEAIKRVERNQEHNDEMTAAIDQKTGRLVSIADKVISTHDVSRWVAKTILLWGSVLSMIATGLYFAFTGHFPGR